MSRIRTRHPRVRRHVGYQAVVTAEPGSLLLGGVRETRSTPFETRAMAQRFVDQAIAANREAGRPASGRVILYGGRERPITRAEVGENNGNAPRARSWRLCGACGQRHGPRRSDCDVGMDELRSRAPGGSFVCDCGKVLRSRAAAMRHFESGEWIDSEGRRRRHDSDQINGNPARRRGAPRGHRRGCRCVVCGRGSRRANAGGVRTVYNRLLGAWYNVTGPHQTPIGGRYSSKAAAQAALYAPRQGAECPDCHGSRKVRLSRPDGTGACDSAFHGTGTFWAGGRQGNPEPSTARFRALVRYASGLRPRSWGQYAAQYGDWIYGKGPLPRRPADMDSRTADRIAAAVAKIYDVRDNPQGGSAPRGGRGVLIYPDGRLTGSWYGRHRTGGRYKHKFGHSHASIYGLPDGSIVIKASHGRLWKNFDFKR